MAGGRCGISVLILERSRFLEHLSCQANFDPLVGGLWACLVFDVTLSEVNPF